jgi:hypothetical protein
MNSNAVSNMTLCFLIGRNAFFGRHLFFRIHEKITYGSYCFLFHVLEANIGLMLLLSD